MWVCVWMCTSVRVSQYITTFVIFHHSAFIYDVIID